MGVETLSDKVFEVKGMETLHTLKDTVPENEIQSLGDTQLEGNAKALDYQIIARQGEVKVGKLGDIRQSRK